MNFLKRAGAILMLVAVFVTSCNKYDDDFKQLNTKLDALATSVAGVTQLSTDLAAVKAQVTALQAVVAAQPNPTAALATLTTNLAAVTTKVGAITTALNNLATAGTATKAIVDGLKTDLAALATKVASDNAALTAQLNTLTAGQGTLTEAQAAQKLQLEAILASNATLTTNLATVQTSLDALTSSQDAQATQASVDALKVLLEAQAVEIAIIKANTILKVTAVAITGTAQIGVELKATTTPADATVTYQWSIATTATGTYSDIAGATTSKYTILAADLGKFIKVKATGTGSYIGSSALSTATAAVVAQTAVTAIGAPTSVSGAIQVGVELTAGALTPAAGTVTYQWQSATTITGVYTDIAGATASKYTPVVADVNNFIRVIATGSFGYFGVVTSPSVGAVLSANLTSPSFASVAGNNKLTITLTGGSFKAAPITAADFTFTGVDAAIFAASTFVRVDATTVTATAAGASVYTPGSLNVITVLAATQATPATSVSVVASTAVVLTNVTSAVATATAAQNAYTITLNGGTFKTGAIVAADFTFAGTNAGALAAGIFTRVNATTVTITGLTLAASVNDAVTVLAATQVVQSSSVTFVPSVSTDIITPAYASAVANNTVTITLGAGGVFKAALTAADFAFSGGTAADHAALAAGRFFKVNATTATITTITGLTGVATNRITVKASAMTTAAATATAAASTITSVISAGVNSTAGLTSFSITLTGGTFKAGAITSADFTFGGVNAAALALGTFTRTNDNTVTITDLILATDVTSSNVVLVKAATQSSQAASATGLNF